MDNAGSDGKTQRERTPFPKPVTMPAGGTEFETRTITCDRCGEPATKTFEGKTFMQLCDGCWNDLATWIRTTGPHGFKGGRRD